MRWHSIAGVTLWVVDWVGWAGLIWYCHVWVVWWQADISRHSVAGRQWEVYRFILQDKTEQPITMGRTRHNIEEQVRTTLLG